MSTIRVVWGGATGPTPMASYDAALAEANVHDFNLVTVSSVIPAGPAVAVERTAPDLGPAGERLTVVQSRDTVGPGSERAAVAGLGWARGADRGPGIFYEAAGADPGTVRETIEAGLDHGAGLRDWSVAEQAVHVRKTASATAAHTTQVVCAVYGDSDPLV
jgi:arginine decarboxylase